MTLALQYDFGAGILLSIFCIVIVYAILYLITLAVSPLKYLKVKAPVIEPVDELRPETPFRIEDIKDDDMMVAALVASIDCREATHQDVHVTSIKEIK
jgi:glutaconyl-CoA/methylmalonyl-CoA decarboxylase subunit delta